VVSIVSIEELLLMEAVEEDEEMAMTSYYTAVDRVVV